MGGFKMVDILVDENVFHLLVVNKLIDVGLSKLHAEIPCIIEKTN
jgi:hypothetical protein